MDQRLDAYGMMNCKFCVDNIHYVKTARRYPILITLSFLNGWRTPFLRSGEYDGDDFHVDSISVPGATIETLMLAFTAEYGQISHPVDICLAASLNNFENDTVLVMLRKYKAFKKLVLNRNDGSTFSICTLPLAPKLTDIQQSCEPGHGWIGGPQTAKMVRLNEGIKSMNA